MTRIHFGWFAGNGYGPLGWSSPEASAGYDWRKAEVYQTMAAICEKGIFDYVLFADQTGVPLVYQGVNDMYIKHGVHLYMDPSVLVAYVAAATKHIGVGTTVSTGLMPPYILARQVASLAHLTKGRVAWNVVTTANIAGYLNMGIDELPGHNARYDHADEYLDLVTQLWGSWEPGAMVMDKETHVFADPAKVHPVNFEGDHFYCRGPLAAAPVPQGRPALIQAGSSDRGMEFAARWVDAVIVSKTKISDMKKFHDELKTKVAKHGRDPEELKIFFNIHPIIGDSEEHARAKSVPVVKNEQYAVEGGLAYLSQALGHDMSQYDLDKPLPDFGGQRAEHARTAFTDHFTGKGPTLRQKAIDAYTKTQEGQILGSAEQVADRLAEIMESVGGDGFNITCAAYSHAYMLEIVNSVIPILQKRGLVPTEYKGTTLRDHLAQK